MISESQYWKEDLARWATKLERRQYAKRWTERSVAQVEKATMIGCFAIRRLIEAKGRLSENTITQPIPVIVYRAKKSHMTVTNWLNLDRHFALDSHRQQQLSLSDLCNQLIHSYVFTVVLDDDGGLEGLIFVSEYRRKRALYHVHIEDLIDVFRRTSTDYPDHIDAVFDPSIGDYRVSARTLEGHGA